MTVLRPFILQTSCEPPVIIIAGTSARIAPMSTPGIILSHEASSTRPSSSCTPVIISTELAITSRMTSSKRKCGIPIGTAPQVAMVPNSNGVPPACSMPARTRFARRSRCAWPSPASFAVFTIPMSGRLRSSSS